MLLDDRETDALKEKTSNFLKTKRVKKLASQSHPHT
jgi:hypothetical protein